MASENALALLAQLDAGKALLPPAILIAGPQAFLKEYVLDACRHALRGPGVDHQSFQVGASTDYGAVLEAVGAPGLFAPATVATCRILRARAGGADEDGEGGGESRAGRSSEESALSRAIELVAKPSHLILLYERDKAPAKVQRQIEKSGLSIVCNKPFESQIPQFANLFAQRLGLKINYAIADGLAERYGTNLAAMNNALVLAAIAGQQRKPEEFLRSGAAVDLGGELFQISESLSGEMPLPVLAMIDRAVALGRDPTELLAVEIIPSLRRLVIAAALGLKGQGPAEIAMEIGMSPRSPRVTAIAYAARRYGLRRLTRTYREAIKLDANFKNGTVKERHQALSALLAPMLLEEPSRTKTQ